jgi:hypothetical protein
MSAADTHDHEPAARPPVYLDPAGRATAVAGVLLLGALVLALAGTGDASLPLAVCGVGVVVALFVLGPVAASTLRRRPALVAGALVLVLPFFLLAIGGLGGFGPYGIDSFFYWLGLGGLRPGTLLPIGLVLLAGVGGVVLLADDLQARLGGTARTPWQRITGAAASGVPDAAPGPWRVLAGLALVGLAAVFGLVLVDRYAGGSALLEFVLLLGVAGGALVLVGVPVLIAGLARADRGRVQAAREDERQRMAAHLHDSVLQTLALVQRQAHDPAAVSRLVRRQEHELRAWMAGEVEPGSDTLAGALRDAVAEVEDDQGLVVEVTILGDRPLDPPGEALAAAAREALRNAARHAAGADVFVFAQIGRAGAEVFVRDDGPGFEPAAVAPERRGVRDAIVGRMAGVGGAATIDSAPGHGTEVALRVGILEERA